MTKMCIPMIIRLKQKFPEKDVHLTPGHPGAL